MTTERRWSRIALRSFALLVGLAVATVLAEAFVRSADLFGISYYRDVNRYFNEAIRLVPDALHEQGRLFENAPGTDLQLVQFDWRTDTYGLRSSTAGAPFEPARSEPHDRFRILFLGDSVTLAWGVDDEDSWTRRLEDSGRSADGRPLECLNAGHLSYDSVQEADWLAAHGPELQPDLVVLTYVVNDIESTWEQYKDFLQPDEAAVAPPERTLGQVAREKASVWFRGLYGVWHFTKERRAARTVEEHEAVDVSQQPGYADAWMRSENALERMRATCAELGVPFVVFDHTVPPIPDVEAWCVRAGVPYYDFRFTPEEWEADITNSRADAHANERGQEFLEQKARAFLAAGGWLAGP